MVEILISGNECDASFANWDNLPIATCVQNTGCDESDASWGSASAQGTLRFGYP